MVEKLIEAIGKSLEEKWDGAFKVYTENVYQSAVKPCFFIECENAEQMQLLGGKFFLRVCVKVTLDSDDECKKYQAEAVLGDMFNIMSLAMAGDRVLRGKKINAKWESGKLVVRSVYDIFIEEENEEEEKTLMRTIEADRKEVL